MQLQESARRRWLRHEGEMADRIRSHDWGATLLGPMDGWPQSLRTAINLMLPSQAQMVVFWGPELVTFYNDAYAPTIGTKHPFNLGRPAREGWAELWDDLGPLLHSVWQTGETVAARDRPFQINRQGFLEQVYFDISYSAIRGESGEVEGVLCIVSETTQRVLAAQALAESEARLRTESERLELALNAGAVLGAWVWDIVHDRFTGDERFARTFAMDPVPLQQGLPLEQVKQSIHPADMALVNARIAAAMAQGGAYSAEYRVPREDGSWRWIEANGRVELDAQGRPARFPGVLIDIDRRREAEETLRALNAQLEQRVKERTRDLEEAQARLHQSQKMEALGQLTGGIAHDFNNLLQGITGSIEVIRRRYANGQPAEIERFADSALQSARRAAALVHRLLAFARRQSLDTKVVNVNTLVQSMDDLLRRTLGENVALQVTPDPNAWNALCDENQLEAAILNLAINARDAMPEGGRLRIATGNATLGELQLPGQETMQPGDYACITVSDSGAGMDPQVLARAFEPFFTTKPVGQGTGLGLSMIYGFARQSGGGVRLESAPGHGTVATLYLPRHAPVVEPQAPEPGEVPRGGGEVVLVVEDQPSVRMLVIEVLHELGYRTIESANGDAALRFLQADGRIDLLVTDVGLPGMNGRQLAEMARAKRPGLPVLLMTGYAAAAAERTDFLPEGTELITKPFAMSALARKVQAMMEAARGA
ncbi:response regulator [Ramlibacter sp. XY19]|uniref:ATP-binding protein n=1 Tax=Ramlibacter paludis TaxID=2908000 RepID=UPI0023DC2AFB|nr:ATP-binding protein [Ramlibacter paludis]MCG2592127.1 response regulator [Ramlibacter paludis]